MAGALAPRARRRTGDGDAGPDLDGSRGCRAPTELALSRRAFRGGAARRPRRIHRVLESFRGLKREQLEHVLRAASRIVDAVDLLVIGSQSVLATWDERRLPR